MDPPVYNPAVPYTGFINGGFRAGRLVRVQGKINYNANSFQINLQCGPSSNHDDVALHVNPRFSENSVIRNSKNYSSWGNEERHGNSFPFTVGQSFEVMIVCEAQQFKIAINGQHFCEYNHRVSVERISSISIDGDITISLIQFEGTSAPAGSGGYMPSAPSMGASAPGGMPPPYPPAGSGGMPMGFVPPPSGPQYPSAAPGYPSNPPPAYPSNPPAYPNAPPAYPNAPPAYPNAPPAYPNAPSAGYPAGGPPQGGYPYSPAGGGYPPQQGYPQQQPGHPSAYPQQHFTGGGYCPNAYPTSPHNNDHGHYQQQGYPQGQHGSKGGGLMDNAGKMLAGGLAGVGLAKVASKIPGMGGMLGGHGHGHSGPQAFGGHPGGHGGGGGGGMGKMGGILGGAAALGLGGAVAGKALKGHKKKNKLLKYGVPLAGVGLGGYALKKGMKGFKGHGHGGSSSSSYSSDSD